MVGRVRASEDAHATLGRAPLQDAPARILEILVDIGMGDRADHDPPGPMLMSELFNDDQEDLPATAPCFLPKGTLIVDDSSFVIVFPTKRTVGALLRSFGRGRQHRQAALDALAARNRWEFVAAACRHVGTPKANKHDLAYWIKELEPKFELLEAQRRRYPAEYAAALRRARVPEEALEAVAARLLPYLGTTRLGRIWCVSRYWARLPRSVDPEQSNVYGKTTLQGDMFGVVTHRDIRTGEAVILADSGSPVYHPGFAAG